MLFCIWLFSSLILSKSFNGILLNSYFNVKYEPIVKTLEDIRDNKNIILSGNYHHLSKRSKENHFNINDILERIVNNKDIFPNNPDNIELVVKGEIVLFSNSIQRRTFMDVYDSYKDRIYISSTKYLPNYSVYAVHKNREYSKIIQYL